ncbi:MAG: zinc ribbon domain-containing protein [Gemmatimonadota bacterium]
MSARYGELLELLRDRLAEAGRPPDAAVSIAELQRVLLPYATCREALGYSGKAEYDLAMLRLLAGRDGVRSLKAELAEAVERELDAPEPGLEFLERFATFEVKLSPPVAASPHPDASGMEPVEGPARDSTASSGRCWRCRERLPPRKEVRFCPFCGEDQTARRCLDCGESLEAPWKYCPRCGQVAPWE